MGSFLTPKHRRRRGHVNSRLEFLLIVHRSKSVYAKHHTSDWARISNVRSVKKLLEKHVRLVVLRYLVGPAGLVIDREELVDVVRGQVIVTENVIRQFCGYYGLIIYSRYEILILSRG